MSYTIYSHNGKQWVWEQSLLDSLSEKSPGERFVDFCVSNPGRRCQLRNSGEPVKTYDPDKHRGLLKERIQQRKERVGYIGEAPKVQQRKLGRGKSKGGQGREMPGLFGAQA